MGRLGRHIQSLRRKRELTIRDLGEAIGKTPGYLSRVEVRDEIPSPDLICSISDVLQEKPETLLDLAKQDLMQRMREQIERKASEALSLYRRSR
jgi:transcriptional regulator with XRE-family HTH domain